MSPEEREHSHARWLKAAAVYNAVWGMANIAMPRRVLRVLGVPEPGPVFAWQTVGRWSLPTLLPTGWRRAIPSAMGISLAWVSSAKLSVLWGSFGLGGLVVCRFASDSRSLPTISSGGDRSCHWFLTRRRAPGDGDHSSAERLEHSDGGALFHKTYRHLYEGEKRNQARRLVGAGSAERS